MSAPQAEAVPTYRFDQSALDSAWTLHAALSRVEMASPDLIMNDSWCEQRYFAFAEFFYMFEATQ